MQASNKYTNSELIFNIRVLYFSRWNFIKEKFILLFEFILSSKLPLFCEFQFRDFKAIENKLIRQKKDKTRINFINFTNEFT